MPGIVVADVRDQSQRTALMGAAAAQKNGAQLLENRCVTAFSHMTLFIAGAMVTGACSGCGPQLSTAMACAIMVSAVTSATRSCPEVVAMASL